MTQPSHDTTIQPAHISRQIKRLQNTLRLTETCKRHIAHDTTEEIKTAASDIRQEAMNLIYEQLSDMDAQGDLAALITLLDRTAQQSRARAETVTLRKTA